MQVINLNETSTALGKVKLPAVLPDDQGTISFVVTLYEPRLINDGKVLWGFGENGNALEIPVNKIIFDAMSRTVEAPTAPVVGFEALNVDDQQSKVSQVIQAGGLSYDTFDSFLFDLIVDARRDNAWKSLKDAFQGDKRYTPLLDLLMAGGVLPGGFFERTRDEQLKFFYKLAAQLMMFKFGMIDYDADKEGSIEDGQAEQVKKWLDSADSQASVTKISGEQGKQEYASLRASQGSSFSTLLLGIKNARTPEVRTKVFDLLNNRKTLRRLAVEGYLPLGFLRWDLIKQAQFFYPLAAEMYMAQGYSTKSQQELVDEWKAGDSAQNSVQLANAAMSQEEEKMQADIGLNELAQGFIRKEGDSWRAHMWIMSPSELDALQKGSRNYGDMQDKLQERAQQLLSQKLGRDIKVANVNSMGPLGVRGEDGKVIDRTVWAVVFSDNVGGIDFAQSNLNMQIKRDGAGVPLPVSAQDLSSIHIDGLVPEILSIRSAAGTPLFGQS